MMVCNMGVGIRIFCCVMTSFNFVQVLSQFQFQPPPPPSFTPTFFSQNQSFSAPRDGDNNNELTYRNKSLVNYVVLAPSHIYPASVYTVVVTVRRAVISPLDVTVSIAKDGVEIQGNSGSIEEMESKSFNVLITRQLTPGAYRLRVEGNYPNTHGGSLFLHETPLVFSARFLTILIQTNRHVYNGGQKVMFRVVLLKRDLRPYEDAVDVYILDARGIVMRRWPSMVSNQGVVDLTYELPEYSNLGPWRIRVVADTQVEEKVIQVEKYFQPQFEVFVSMDPFILASEQTITAAVSGFYGTEKTVRGNATVSLFAFQYGEPRKKYTFVDEVQVFLTGEEEVKWDISAVYDAIGPVSNLGIRVEAEVKEYFIGESRIGFAESRVISETYRLKFINTGPPVFKPGLPFVTHLAVMYSDLQRIPSEKLENSILRVMPTAETSSGGSVDLPAIEMIPISNDIRSYSDYFDERREYLEMSRLRSFWENGVLPISIDVPRDTVRLNIRAEFADEAGNQIRTQITANSVNSPSRKYLSVWTTSTKVVVGEYVTLRVSANFNMQQFNYLVMAKGLIIHSGKEILRDIWSLPKTFSLPVSSQMVPAFQVLVYYIGNNEEIVADSVFVPVHVISRHSMDLKINQHKDRSKDTLEITMLGDPGAYFAMSAQRSVRQFMQAGNEFSAAGVFATLYSLEPSNRSVHVVTWRDRNGERPDRSEYFPSMNYGINAAKTFSLSSLHVFSDTVLPGADSVCEEGQLPCSTQGCYVIQERCDGVTHCPDGTDEFNCDVLSDEDLIAFRVDRISRFMDFYDPSDGDWAWAKQNIAHGGDYIFTLNVPKITDTWHFNAFAVSKKNGFALLEQDVVYETKRPFMMIVDAPSSIRRGEQLGIIALLYNKTPKDIYVVVVLKGSDDFVFVHVGKHGLVDFSDGSPQYSSGDHQHFVWIPAESELEVRFPIRPIIDQGTITVTLQAMSQIRQDEVQIEVEVLAEGVQIGKHTSMLLDLQSRATVLRFLDIYPEESPIIPYDYKRKYVYGSVAGHVVVTGDVFGPVFPQAPVSMSALIGKTGKGTADRIFDLAANVWSLHYLRLTNQLDPVFARKIFVQMNKFFAHIMKRYSPRGWFKMWNLSRPSVWLSAWALQVFHHASFQDWETYFYVENRIFSAVVEWLLNFQNFDGSFRETRWFRYPLNKRMTERKDYVGPMNVTITAHVAITLHHVLGSLDGKVRVDASIAKFRAIQYLESVLQSLTDPHQIAMTAYTLTLSDSPAKEAAFSKLHSLRRDEGGMIYWSPGEVPTNAIIYETSRPFVQPKNNEYWDSVALEATAFALLTYLIRDGISPTAEKIVVWLHSMRLTDGAFIGTLDTAVALEALTEYANRARLRDITEMSILIDVASSDEVDEVSRTVFINSSNIAEYQSIDISQVWGHVNVLAKGSGQAVVQLDVTFGVDRDEFKDTPAEECFELRIREFYSEERNKTALTVESCFRWILTTESDVSGTAVLEVEIPSGYGMVQSDAINLVSSRVHPTLRDALIEPGKTSWYFDYIPPDWTCFNHTVRRWYPVANLTYVRQATIYEAYAPERFVNTIVNDTSFRYLTICHVCGSYQCPYCPFYSWASTWRPSPLFHILLPVAVILLSSTYSDIPKT